MNTATALRIATLLALWLGSGALPAADLDENFDLAGGNADLAPAVSAPLQQQAMVRQLGNANVALLTQKGQSLVGRIVQIGSDQEALILQDGMLNLATITQQGQGNQAYISQSGAYNQADITQAGAYNNASLCSPGRGSIAASPSMETA